MMASKRLTLIPGCWYAWTMWPGYVDEAYHSPIRVDLVKPLTTGTGRFDLTFFNSGYASGVQCMTYALRTLKREAGYVLASVEDSDRAVCIEPISRAWLDRHVVWAKRMLQDRAGATDVSMWLDGVFGNEGR